MVSFFKPNPNQIRFPRITNQYYNVFILVNFCSVEGPSAESKTLIVRNLSYDTSEEDLKDAFDGSVSCRLMTHTDSGKSKGSVATVL